jgi:two-component system, OmpR family, sensor histidine kinase CiaH
MFSAARLRLTLWYLLILTVIVGLLSFVLYRILVNLHQAELHAISPSTRGPVARLFAHHQPTLALQVLGVDAVVLVLAGVGAYVLAGRTLRPINQAMARQLQFAAAASHELRTPLTSIQGTIEVALLKRRKPREYEQILQESLDDISRMSILVKDLLVLARAQHDVDTIALAPLDLRILAQDAVATLRPRAEERQLQVEVDLDDSLPVLGDSIKLRQVLSNLLDNAVHYTPVGGTVTVIGTRANSQAWLEVRDTGEGIDAAHLAHVFEPFYQVDPDRGGNDSHVGMGLAFAAWIVKAHGGHLEVKSRLGVGSAFTLTLPLAK